MKNGLDELKIALLQVEMAARRLVDLGNFENRYAKNHLREVSAFSILALAQVEYARLAIDNPPDRSDDNPPPSIPDTEIITFGDEFCVIMRPDGSTYPRSFRDDPVPGCSCETYEFCLSHGGVT